MTSTTRAGFHAFVCLLLSVWSGVAHGRLPFLPSKRKASSSYTPLVFFTVPKGLIAENDALERQVRTLEKELGVRVERLDILRSPAAEAVLTVLTNKSPPFLYHRESCQTIHVPNAASSSSGGGGSTASLSPTRVVVDPSRLRAWARGHPVSSSAPTRIGGSAAVRAPLTESGDSTAMDQDELLLEDLSLTPLQRKGKEAMRERTAQKSRSRQRNQEDAQ